MVAALGLLLIAAGGFLVAPDNVAACIGLFVLMFGCSLHDEATR